MTHTNQYGDFMAQGIVNIIREWLFGPPVPVEPKECENCEVLREQLTFANYDRKILLERILEHTFPSNENKMAIDMDTLKPMSTGKKPWRVRQQELEEASRKAAQQLRHNATFAGPQTDVRRSESGGVTFTPPGQTLEQLEEELSLKVP